MLHREPRVLNIKKHGLPPDAVYIGRPTKWSNPFKIGRDGDRQEVIEKFEDYVGRHPELRAQAKIELRGRDLVCHCSPLECHGDLWIVIANDPY